MARRWVENMGQFPKQIGGALVLPGAGNWVDDGPLSDPPPPAPLSAGQVAALGAAMTRPKRIKSLLGAVCCDLVALSGLPAGASFSGAGSYASAGILAVQSTGTITHNPTGWHDGTACLEFVPNTDANAEFRIYIAAGVNISDDDGIAFEYILPEPDTAKVNFSIHFDFSHDATNLFPTNTAAVPVWRCDQTNAQTKEKGGRKYVRQRWDHDTTDAKCGAWPGYGITTAGTGADRTKLAKWIRFRASKFSGKVLKFKYVRRGGVSTPAFILGSDNITPEDLALRAFGYMAQKGIAGYVCQYLSQLQTDPASLDRMRRIYAAGHEVPGDDTVDRPLGQTVFDAATMRSAVETTRDTLRGYGFSRGSRVWVANNNSTSYLMIEELARAGYVANRNGDTDGRMVFTEGGVPDPFRLPATGLDNKTWAQMQPMVDRTIEYGATLWLYWHGVISSARLDADRAANVTGNPLAPIARNANETAQAYRARMVGLGSAEGTASVTYFDARVGAAGLAVWWEDLKQLFDYLAPKNQDGTCAVVTPDEWCNAVGLLPDWV